MTRANEALRFIFDTVQVLDPHPNISHGLMPIHAQWSARRIRRSS
jgi:hypothetical protein